MAGYASRTYSGAPKRNPPPWMLNCDPRLSAQPRKREGRGTHHDRWVVDANRLDHQHAKRLPSSSWHLDTLHRCYASLGRWVGWERSEERPADLGRRTCKIPSWESREERSELRERAREVGVGHGEAWERYKEKERVSVPANDAGKRSQPVGPVTQQTGCFRERVRPHPARESASRVAAELPGSRDAC